MMKLEIPTYEDVKRAAQRLDGHAKHTPMLRHDMLDKITGYNLFLKNETDQKTGSFKYRGAYSRLSALSNLEKKQGVVAFSSGNHAQGVALAAKELGISAIIVMPKTAPVKKKQGTLSHGAQIVEYDPETETRETIAEEIGKRDNRIVVPAYDDPYIISGQGTVGKEIAEYFSNKNATPDVVITPVGGGGLCAGINLSMQALSPRTKVYGAEPRFYDDTYRSLEEGRILPNVNPPATLCDALMSPAPGNITFAINQPALSGVFRVTDTECLLTMTLLKKLLDITVEPGGSVAISALLTGRTHIPKGATVVAVLSGGNVDTNVIELAQTTTRALAKSSII